MVARPAEQLVLVSGDLDHPGMVQFIVTDGGREFPYLQGYPLGDWHTGLGEQPEGTRGLDQFASEADMIRRCHGPHSSAPSPKLCSWTACRVS